MISRTVRIPPIPLDPAPLNLRWPLGIPLDLRLTFQNVDGDDLDVGESLAQFVLFPRSRGGQHPYDMTVYDAVNGVMGVKIPGNDLTDDKGYRFEIYSRVPAEVEGNPAVPDFMQVMGNIVTFGSAYSSTGPQSMVNIPVVQGPPGPAGAPGAAGAPGPEGPQGTRGTMWFTGTGPPTLTDPLVFGDMYLDQSNGDVWQWEGAMWVLT